VCDSWEARDEWELLRSDGNSRQSKDIFFS
jgi:hypothetical protein